MDASLSDVLRCLGSKAADSLFVCLRSDSCLSAARLSCSALRSFIDSNATSLSITVRAGDRQRWAAGQLPPSLTRWPRGCRHVTVAVEGPLGAGDDTALLALLPFAEPAVGKRIESLTLRTVQGSSLRATNGELLVCMLVQRLPALRSLEVKLLEFMSYDSLSQQLMYDALAALSQLERLTLPGLRCLDRVGALAASASLRHLRIAEGLNDSALLSAAAIAGIAQLQRLEELVLHYCAPGIAGSGSEAPAGLHALLLTGLPPSLRQLNVATKLAATTQRLEITLSAGCFSRVAVVEDRELGVGSWELGEFLLHDLAALAELLLGSPAMGPMMERLELPWIVVCFKGLGEVEPTMQARAAELLQRCAHVRTGDVSISEQCAPAADQRMAVELLPLLGPETVTLTFWMSYAVVDELRLSFRGFVGISGTGPDLSPGLGTGRSSSRAPGEAAVTAAPNHGGQGSGSQGQRSTPPDPADLVRAALRRMAPRQSSVGGTAGDRATSSSGSPGGSLLLLRGPFVAMMANSGPALSQWVRHLANQAEAAAPGNDWGGKPVLSCQEVPLVPEVLVSCRSGSAAAAMAAAARGAAEAAAAPVGMLEAVSVQSAESNAAVALFRALEPVITAFWEGSGHGGGVYVWQERLQCLRDLSEHFRAKIPPEEGEDGYVDFT